MRHIRRKDRPALFNDPDIADIRRQLAEFHERGGTRATKQVLNFKELFATLQYNVPGVTEALEETFGNYCAYTERPVTLGVPSVGAGEIPGELTLHRPPRDAIGADDEVSPSHYYWLVTEWRNWYLATTEVTRRKGHRFPVFGQRSEPPPRGDDKNPRTDRGVLLDPCVDHPQWYLRANPDGTFELAVRALTNSNDRERAHVSIELLGLNEPVLAFERANQPSAGGSDEVPVAGPYLGFRRQLAARRFLSDPETQPSVLWEQLAPELIPELLHPDHDHDHIPEGAGDALVAAARRMHARKDELARIEQLLSNQPSAPTAMDVTRPIEQVEEPESTPRSVVIRRDAFIQSIEISNFRCIDAVSIEIDTRGCTIDGDVIERDPDHEPTNPSDPCAMFLGENGSGKSSVLQAVALALAGEHIDDILQHGRLRWDRLIRRNAGQVEPQGHVIVRFGHGETIELRFTADGHKYVNGTPDINLPVRAMGASRAVARNGDTLHADAKSHHDVRNLFDPLHRMVEPTTWLRELREQRPSDYNVAEATIREFLQLDADRMALGDDGLEINGMPVDMLSDGYRSVLALLCGIMSVAQLDTTDTESTRGVMLIDEIGAHLHPRWKRRITGLLRKQFPSLQFLITTHEPLCLRGMNTHEVVLVTRDGLGPSRFETIPRSPSRYRVDQLLTSEFFGLGTTIDPEEQDKLDRYYAALTEYEAARDDPRRAGELDTLRATAAAIRPAPTHGVLGVTRREQLVYEVIDTYLATNDPSSDTLPADRREARRKAIRDAADIFRLQVPVEPTGGAGESL